MRVIAGEARGRRLKSVAGRSVRPTADRVKEALFSILGSRFDLEGAEILDLFAGTGAIGIEALSRGARRAVFVEQNHAAQVVLRENLKACGFEERAHVLVMSVERAVRLLDQRGDRFDGVFVDPPYRSGLLRKTLRQLGSAGLVRAGGWVVAEYDADGPPFENTEKLRLTQTRRYGKTCLALFAAGAAA